MPSPSMRKMFRFCMFLLFLTVIHGMLSAILIPAKIVPAAQENPGITETRL